MTDTAFYEALGIHKNASADEIKRAYRKMARKYHPDVNTDAGADAKFKAAGEAYDVLRDPEKRAAYDRFGANWDQPHPDPRAQKGGPWQGGHAFDERDIDPEMFRDFFGQGFGRAQSMRQDQRARVDIALEDAIHGAKQKLTLRSPRIDDTGHVVMETRTIDVNIPKGIMPGQHLRLKGQGGGGDLLIEIGFKPHPVYRIEGRDLFVELPVAPWEAALGGKVRMPTPTGPVDLKIPGGAKQGQKLRLKGRGLPAAQKGDLYAVLHIVNPPKLSAKARDLYAQLAKEQSFNPRAKLGV